MSNELKQDYTPVDCHVRRSSPSSHIIHYGTSPPESIQHHNWHRDELNVSHIRPTNVQVNDHPNVYNSNRSDEHLHRQDSTSIQMHWPTHNPDPSGLQFGAPSCFNGNHSQPQFTECQMTPSPISRVDQYYPAATTTNEYDHHHHHHYNHQWQSQTVGVYHSSMDTGANYHYQGYYDIQQLPADHQHQHPYQSAPLNDHRGHYDTIKNDIYHTYHNQEHSSGNKTFYTHTIDPSDRHSNKSTTLQPELENSLYSRASVISWQQTKPASSYAQPIDQPQDVLTIQLKNTAWSAATDNNPVLEPLNHSSTITRCWQTDRAPPVKKREPPTEVDTSTSGSLLKTTTAAVVTSSDLSRNRSTASIELSTAAEDGEQLLNLAAMRRKNQCHVCGRNYARPSTLKTHLRTHTNERPFKCSVCLKTFSQAANLTAHQRVHTGERPFSCPICGRQFSQSSSVITHLRTHSGERPYRCINCERTFSDSSTLTKHCRIHSGEKPYQCEYCPLNFSQSGNLSRHLKLHLISSSSGSIAQTTNGLTSAGSSTRPSCSKATTANYQPTQGSSSSRSASSSSSSSSSSSTCSSSNEALSSTITFNNLLAYNHQS